MYTLNFKIIDHKTIVFDITQSIHVYPNNGINVTDVFRFLAYDCSICVVVCSMCVKISNKSCCIALDIVVDVKTCTNYKNHIQHLPTLKHQCTLNAIEIIRKILIPPQNVLK